MWEIIKDVYNYDPRFSEEPRKDRPHICIDGQSYPAYQSDLRQRLMKDTYKT